MNHSNDPSFDSDVEWLSIDERQKPRRVIPILLIVGGILLSLITTVVFIGFVIRRTRLTDENVTVTRLHSTSHLQSEAVDAFSNFEASDDVLPGIPLENVEERQAIESLLNNLRAFAAANDSEQFRNLVDHHKLFKRIELGGNLDNYNLLEKRYLRTQLKKSAYVDTYWSNLVVARVLTPEDDHDTRIIYAYGKLPDLEDRAELRLILGWDGDQWKLYDWERLDQGIHYSEEWGVYARHFDTNLYEGFNRWSDLLTESNQLISEGDYENATNKLRQAETQPIPPEMVGYCWLTAGYLWQSAGEQDEALRCFEQISRPQETPGTYFGLMNSYRWKDPARAIEYAKKYKQCVGPTLELCETMARLYQRSGQDENALAEWEQILRIDPNHANALQSLLLALPAEQKSQFENILERQKDPTKAAALVAQSVAWQDPEAIAFLRDYLQRNSPTSPASHYVAGLAQRSAGRLQEAADEFRLAFQAEHDEQTRNGYVENYVDAMSSIGRGVEAWNQSPGKQALFTAIVYEYQDIGSQFSLEELEQISAQFVREFPNSLAGYYFSAHLAEEDGRYAEAEALLRQGLERPSESDPNDNQQYNAETLNYMLANVLYKQGRFSAAYNLTDEKRNRFAQLCHLASQVGHWEAVAAFLELHQAHQSDDPQWHYYKAELAAGKQLWNSAIESLQQGRSLAEANGRAGFDTHILQLSIAAGTWAQHYGSDNSKEDAFNTLAREFIADQDWNGLQQLVLAHRTTHRSDSQVTRHLANAAWEQGDHSAFAKHAKKLLEGEEDSFSYSYTRDLYQARLFAALLRTDMFKEAQQLASRREQKSNDVDYLAIVAAATENHRRAQQLALEVARKDESATAFYHSESTGPVFWGKEYGELQREFPVALPYDFNTVHAVFLSETPWHLDSEQIESALDRNKLSDKKLLSLGSRREESSGCFAIQLDKSGVWLATGKGPFDRGWEFDGETHPLLETAAKCQYWLVVGTVALSETEHREAEDVARRVTGELSKGHSRILCIEDVDSWRGFRMHPAHHDLVSHWIQSGVVPLVLGQGLSLSSWQQQPNVVGDREHRLALSEVARRFESAANPQLEVIAYCIPQVKSGEFRLAVDSISRDYGGLQFEGELVGESQLFPLLRQGLPFRLNLNDVVGWQIDDQEPVYRRD